MWGVVLALASARVPSTYHGVPSWRRRKTCTQKPRCGFYTTTRVPAHRGSPLRHQATKGNQKSGGEWGKGGGGAAPGSLTRLVSARPVVARQTPLSRAAGRRAESPSRAEPPSAAADEPSRRSRAKLPSRAAEPSVEPSRTAPLITCAAPPTATAHRTNWQTGKAPKDTGASRSCVADERERAQPTAARSANLQTLDTRAASKDALG